ncbi:YheC/YheD family protein [Alkalihalobacillus sp. MEB130]|uniref:YheC/YheD family protein n=1 Tax=Alkalihalobacillus sp. MEB130 TaxID=2976704 RepID=UPI0028DEE1F6|nr:YheC/YheD family protein [Alkalihalobacillus sp. MEB130]MDT8861213.1 YheC/YheD family protein [Alkalihalobacillus sp. MEB130]
MASYNRKKWRRYEILKKISTIAPHLPETKTFSEKAFWELMNKYGQIIVKPNNGRRGKGVIKIEEIGSQKYEIQIEDKKLTMGKEETFAFASQHVNDQAYLIQERISLAQIDDRIIDFRVIVQRKTYDDPWTVTAMVVKVAGKGYVVTNIARSGGEILYVEDAVQRSDLNVSPQTLKAALETITVKASERLAKYYSKQRIFGFDMGVDKNGHIYIIEANLDPMMSHFRKLDNQSYYQRIKRYKKGK